MVVRRSTTYTDMLTKWKEVPWESQNVVWNEPFGAYTIESLDSQWDYALEGFFLAHCLGTKDFDEFSLVHHAYSVKDALGFPHCTILCVEEDTWSSYGRSADLGTMEPFWPESARGPAMRVLQVRGREDALAMLPYHKMVREWYEDRGGKLYTRDSVMDAYITRNGDDDIPYHCQYKLDESVNHFNWAYHNNRMRDLYREHGLSL